MDVLVKQFRVRDAVIGSLYQSGGMVVMRIEDKAPRDEPADGVRRRAFVGLGGGVSGTVFWIDETATLHPLIQTQPLALEHADSHSAE